MIEVLRNERFQRKQNYINYSKKEKHTVWYIPSPRDTGRTLTYLKNAEVTAFLKHRSDAQRVHLTLRASSITLGGRREAITNGSSMAATWLLTYKSNMINNTTVAQMITKIVDHVNAPRDIAYSNQRLILWPMHQYPMKFFSTKYLKTREVSLAFLRILQKKNRMIFQLDYCITWIRLRPCMKTWQTFPSTGTATAWSMRVKTESSSASISLLTKAQRKVSIKIVQIPRATTVILRLI